MILAAALLASPAGAYEHLGYAWLRSDIPRAWWVDEGVEDSFAVADQLPALQWGWDAWEDAIPCAGLANAYQGEVASGCPTDDGRSVFYWDDPCESAEVGVLGLTVYSLTDETVEVNGRAYHRLTDTDILFNNDVDWATHDDIVAGRCDQEYDINGVATHEIGHSWGLDHSCDEGDACDEPERLDAVMYWAPAICDTGQDQVNPDDIAGISALYGPYASFTSTGERSGGTPLEVCFDATSEDTLQSVAWAFGDGASSVNNPVCHTYTTSGQFTLRVEMIATSPTCLDPGIAYEVVEPGYVLSCEPPAPEAGADGFFELVHVDGLEYQAIQHVDTTVYACVDTVQWEVYRGVGDEAISPENLVDMNGDGVGDSLGAWAPLLRFPAAGDYVVVMNVGGPGGLAAGRLAVDVREAPGGGCSTLPGAWGGWATLGVVLASIGRRRAHSGR